MNTRIPRKAANTDDFDIPVHANRPAKSLRVKLGKGKADKYDVWQKDLPPDLPSTVLVEGDSSSSQVTWFNNYGIKLKKKKTDSTDNDPFEDTIDHEYTLELDAEPNKRYVVYIGGNAARAMTVAGGIATLRLNLGDPATGHI
jgi:hypothetical protein